MGILPHVCELSQLFLCKHWGHGSSNIIMTASLRLTSMCGEDAPRSVPWAFAALRSTHVNEQTTSE